MASVTVMVEQTSSTASSGNARGFRVMMDRPEAKGGTNEGMMGGEVLLNGLGGCFMSNLLAAAKARKVELRNAHARIEGDISVPFFRNPHVDIGPVQSARRTGQACEDCGARLHRCQYIEGSH
jgi:hypothetical protein